ncbi:MAG: hypothetical protein ACRDLF_10230, partial [Solirubrobacteraceae bacterium]
GLGAWAGAIAGAPALASGEAGGPPGGTGTSPAETGTSPAGTGAPSCPSSNPPNQMTLVAGTPQTATLETAFAAGLQVALSNSDGCPVTSAAAGVPVTFSAPATGPSGVFAASGSYTVTVGADASGAVAAPPFTADGTQGSYTLTATSQYGSVSFVLTNAAAGVWCSALDRRASLSPGEPVKLTTGVGSTQTTPAGAPFPIPLAVTVTDAMGNPVPGAPVTFSAPAAGASGRFAIRFRGSHRHRSRVAHLRAVRVKTNACGIAVAPSFTANRVRGGYVVKASAKPARPAAFALVNEAPGQSQ